MSIITGEELKEKLDQGEDIVIIDLREEEDYKKGHIKGAHNMSMSQVSHEIEDLVEDSDSPICVYCYSGNRSSKVGTILEFLNYTNVYNLKSIDNWSYDLEK